jgi:hypothetical protein
LVATLHQRFYQAILQGVPKLCLPGEQPADSPSNILKS